MTRAAARAACLLAAAALACADGDASRHGAVIGADLLAEPARVVLRERPEHALPTELARLRGELVWVRERPLPLAAWVPVERVPPAWQQRLEMFPGLRLWRTRAAVASSADGSPPELWRHGERLPDLAAVRLPIPDAVVWHDERSGSLLAASAEPPDEVVVRRRAPAREVFGALQADLAEERWSRRRHTLGDVTRPALLLPPPGRVVLELGTLRAERLSLAVGMAREDLRLLDGDVVEGSDPRGDGLVMAVEVEPEGEPPRRVWEQALEPASATVGWHETDVDLSPWRGRRVRVHLVSEARGDVAFDLGLWAGVRLRGGATRPPERPHVVLVIMDTLRADALGVYGAEPSRTPRTDAWIREHAVVVEDAVATASWTLPSTASLLTGLATHQHGVQLSVQSLPAVGPPTLAELLADAGYETRAVTAGGFLRPAFGLDRGFDRYEVLELRSADWQPTLEWLATRDSSTPVFLMVHAYWVHAPWPWDERFVEPGYDGPVAGLEVDYPNVIVPYWEGGFPLDERDAAALRALYDALLAELDVHLGELFGGLESTLAPEGLVLAFTSDHGEAFLEHGVLAHGQALWQELLAVPLVFRREDGRPGRLDTRASLVDVVPTLLHEVGLPRPDDLPGRALFADERGPGVRVAQLEDGQQAVLVEELKLLRHAEGETPPRLFDLRADPGERRDLAGSEPERRAQLEAQLQRFLERYRPPEIGADAAAGLDDETLEELRALGYLGDDG